MWVHVACGEEGLREQRTLRVFNSLRSLKLFPIPWSHVSKTWAGERRQYEERIREIERASFSPLVFTSSGGMSPGTSIFFKHLADLISNKRVQEYSITMNWIRTIISFALLRSAIMYLRGNRSWVNREPRTTGARLSCGAGDQGEPHWLQYLLKLSAVWLYYFD